MLLVREKYLIHRMHTLNRVYMRYLSSLLHPPTVLFGLLWQSFSDLTLTMCLRSLHIFNVFFRVQLLLFWLHSNLTDYLDLFTVRQSSPCDRLVFVLFLSPIPQLPALSPQLPALSPQLPAPSLPSQDQFTVIIFFSTSTLFNHIWQLPLLFSLSSYSSYFVAIHWYNIFVEKINCLTTRCM